MSSIRQEWSNPAGIIIINIDTHIPLENGAYEAAAELHQAISRLVPQILQHPADQAGTNPADQAGASIPEQFRLGPTD